MAVRTTSSARVSRKSDPLHPDFANRSNHSLRNVLVSVKAITPPLCLGKILPAKQSLGNSPNLDQGSEDEANHYLEARGSPTSQTVGRDSFHFSFLLLFGVLRLPSRRVWITEP